MKTSIRFINHASVLISSGETGILSDPWYSSDAFNKGWNLLYENQDSEICEVLNLQFNKFFMEIFFKVELTGDSGRGNEMTTIEPLPPRFISKDFKKEILSSVDFDIISKKFNYKIHKVK